MNESSTHTNESQGVVEKIAHTPLPWEVGEPNTSNPNGKPIGIVSRDAGWIVADVHTDSDELKVRGPANAALIVRAANSHAALVAALERVQLDCMPAGDGLLPTATYELVCAALAAAKGGGA